MSDVWDFCFLRFICNVVGCKSCNFSTENSGWKFAPRHGNSPAKREVIGLPGRFLDWTLVVLLDGFFGCFSSFNFPSFSTILQSYLVRIGIWTPLNILKVETLEVFVASNTDPHRVWLEDYRVWWPVIWDVMMWELEKNGPAPAFWEILAPTNFRFRNLYRVKRVLFTFKIF